MKPLNTSIFDFPLLKKFLVIPLALTVILSVAADALPEQFRWDDVGGTNFVTPVKSQTTADDRSYAYAPLDCLESMRLIYRQTSYAALTKEEQSALVGPAAQLAEAAFQKPGDFDRQWYNNGWPCVFKSIDWMLRSGVDGRRVTDVFMMSPLSNKPGTTGWWGEICYIQQVVSTYGPIVAQYQHLDACLTGGKYYRFPELAPTDWNKSDFSRSVVIVGYDDRVPASKFSDAGSFGTFGDGAWIAKSSYGSGFGEDGYFYISYYDCSLFQSAGWYVSAYWNAFALDNEKAYGSFYAHELECPANFEGADYYSYAAMFTAESDGDIGAIGIMAFGGGRFKVSAFVGCSEGDPVSGRQVLNRDEHYVDALGYHAIGLKMPFAVKKGERFSVIIDSLSGHGLMQLSNPVPGQCFRGTIEYDDDPVTEYKWEDMAYGVENWYGYANACYVTAYALSAPNDFVVKSEPVDVGRLMAHSTAGSEDFWEEAEASFGISKYTFTATPGAIPTANESEAVCSVAVAPESGNYTFTVEASANWTVISDCSWMRVSQGSGAKGTSPIDVTVDANAEGVLRKGELVFTCDRKQRRFVIVQDVMPKVVSWDVYGKDTEEEYVPPGGNKGAPCLVAGRSYIVKLQFSPFNRMRYPVSSIRLQGRASRAPAVSDILDEWQQPVMADGSYVVELESKSCLPKGPGCHGPYDFALEVDCEPFGSIDVSEKIVAKKVFFDKYEKDNGRFPNWFVYWNADGAVPALSGLTTEYFHVPGAKVIHRIEELDESQMCAADPNTFGMAQPDMGRIIVYDAAADGHYYLTRPDDLIEVGQLNFSQPWVYGIYTVANVIAHEQQHIDTYRTYVDELKSRGIAYKAECEIPGLEDYDSDSHRQWKYEEKCQGFFAKCDQGTYIYYNDKLTDCRETEINKSLWVEFNFKLSDEDVDTFDLEHKKDKKYKTDGDNEFMSMLAGYRANKDASTAIEANDWAYPGHQSYLPNGVLRKDQVVTGSKQDPRRLALAKSESPARVEESETPFVASNGVIVAVNGEAVSRGEAESLAYRLSFDVTGSETIRFVGYLIDPASNVVACAGATVELTASNNGCELSFPTNEIFASGFKGPYTLSGMIIYRASDMDYFCECICRDLVTDWVNCGPSNPDVPGDDTSACSFAKSQLSVGESEKLELVVFGGDAEKAASVAVYLTYQTAAAADLDLKAATVDGVMPKGGLKFPLTLSWKAGEVTNRVIRIPVKADKLVEGDETLVFQLAAAQGQELGETMECKVVVRDANSSVTLQDAVLFPGVKLTNKGTGPWKVSPGNREDPDGSKGLYHLETPSMPQGGTSDLTVGALKAGTFYFELRFVGNLDEEIPSRLEIYDRDGLAGVVEHGVGNREGWFGCASNEWTGVQLALGNVTGDIRLVFVQGSDPNVRAELSTFEWWTGAAGPWYCVRALRGSGQGRVSGSGLFSKGATAKLTATPLPGWRFDGWYAYDADTNRFLWSSKASVSVKVSNDLEVQAHFSKIPYVAGLADPADGGKVTGCGSCAAGKKVTLKATANKNFTFVGWYAAAGGASGEPVSRLPSLVLDRSTKPAKSDAKQFVITNVSESVTYYARFVSDPEVFVTVAATDGKGDALTGKGAGKYVAGTITGMGKYAKDKKVTLKATANRGYVFSGWWPGDVSGDGGQGLAALPSEVGSAPRADRTTALSLAASYVFTMPTNDVAYVAAFVTAEEDATNIVASVNGMAFGAGSGGEGADVTKLATNVMCGVYLEWPVTASALSETTVKVAGLPSGLKFTAKPITSKVTSGTVASKVTTVVTNVPANTIYGAPTAASKTAKNPATGLMTVKPSEVKVTVTTAGKNAQTYQIDATVDPLPAWAVGTFAGPSYGGGRGATALPGDTNGAVSVTVATSGKITAKQPVDGKSTSFTANYFDAYDGGSFRATLTAKSGKIVLTNEMAVCGHTGRVTLPGGGEQIVTNGVIEADLFDAWQYNWKDDSWKAIGKSFDKRTLTYVTKPDGSFSEAEEDVELPIGEVAVGRVTLKFAASGSVAVAGEFAKLDDEGAPVYKSNKLQTVKASGSATLLPTVGEDGETRYLVFVYLAPKGLQPHARCLEVPSVL